MLQIYKLTFLSFIFVLLCISSNGFAQTTVKEISASPEVEKVKSTPPKERTSELSSSPVQTQNATGAPSSSVEKIPESIPENKATIATTPTPTPEITPTPEPIATPTPRALFTQKPLFPTGSVIFIGEPIFEIQAAVNDLSKDERAKIITRRLNELSIGEIKPEGIVIANNLTTSNIIFENKVLATITEKDAKYSGLKRQDLAVQIQKKIQESIKKYQRETSIQGVSINAVWALATTLIFLLMYLLLKKVFPKIYDKIDEQSGKLINDIKVNNLVIVSAEHMTNTCVFIAKLIYGVTVLTLLYIYFPLVFSFFPWTRNLGYTLIGYVTGPLSKGFYAFIDYIPNIIIIAIIGVLTNYALKLTKIIFDALENEDISYPGFHQDWARPTYKIVRFLILAFALVVAFPYLPGSNSPAFRGVSLFLGVLFSLGSTSAVANIVAGLVMTYMRPFRIGDLVKISDTMGNVIEKTLLVTRIRTTKNEDITIPNAMILNSHILNYSSSATSGGVSLILHTTVTIGYDVPWREVHEMLLKAASQTPHLSQSPEPFIFQKSLDDFYVSYELNMYTEMPNKMGLIYSHIHQNIQDIFNEAGVEILSPHYRAPRDGNETTIPASYLSEDYQPPAFRVEHIKG